MEFRKLPSNSKQLLDDLLQAENPSELLCGRFENLAGQSREELRGIIRELREEGYIKVFWADNLPYEVTINNSARTYNERLAEYEAEKARSHQQNFFSGSFTNNGNMVFGNVSGSTLSVDNSIHKLERDIEELGGDDKEELQELLDEVKELIENIQSSRTIPKQKRLFQRLNDHVVKHGWFYSGVVQLLGTAVMKCLGYA